MDFLYIFTPFLSRKLQQFLWQKAVSGLVYSQDFFVVVLSADMLPVPGPIIGRHIAGLVAKEGIWNGAKLGLTAGIFSAHGVSIMRGVILIAAALDYALVIHDAIQNSPSCSKLLPYLIASSALYNSLPRYPA